ncbi:hypothetical protein [Endozoicomonas sp. SCSIO W0465]|uniref:hypothetical protein n=1 Tax=Endozoicomonas sp. SCSIO W0465 TaxID=2918516 RepID=UPI0020752FEF|nr:hypothetical protein [Endozoicomonas sp. SCSIO W0465]USE37429.1 hypothetical protein MJO57_04165 [Endozoicomonas sp. SCSIO W0465]
MEVCQPLTKVANDSCPAIDQLQQKLTLLRQSNNPIQHFEDHENEIHSLFIQAEREILAEELQKLDINKASIEVNGVVYHQALRSYQTYQSAAGPVRVLRSLYRNAGDKCIVPLELKAGVVEGYWLPKAAKQAAWMVAQLPPADVKSLLDLMGNMSPSTSSLARLPKKTQRTMGAAP